MGFRSALSNLLLAVVTTSRNLSDGRMIQFVLITEVIISDRIRVLLEILARAELLGLIISCAFMAMPVVMPEAGLEKDALACRLATCLKDIVGGSKSNSARRLATSKDDDDSDR